MSLLRRLPLQHATTTDRRGRVAWAEFEVPDAAGSDRRGFVSWMEFEIQDDRRGRVSWMEFETADPVRRARVSWLELEVPDAPRRGRVSWLEFETPDAQRQGRISWLQFEVPDPVRRGRVSWLEFEVPDPNRRGFVSWLEFEVPSPGYGTLVGEAPLRAVLAGPGPYFAILGGDMTCTADPTWPAKQKETRALRALAVDAEGNRPVLAGASAVFRLATAERALLFEAAAVVHAVEQTDPDGDPYNLEYLWAAPNDLNRAAGAYLGEFVVTLAGGQTVAVPSGNSYIRIPLAEDLA